MHHRHRTLFMSLAATVALIVPLGLPAAADATIYDVIAEVESGNPRLGLQVNEIAPGWTMGRIAIGSDPIENPAGAIIMLGYLNDFPPQTIEPTKTEPDENLYLVFDHNPRGTDAGLRVWAPLPLPGP